MDYIDEYLEVALAETFSKPGVADVTPADRAKLKGLLKHYAKKAHPFTACKRDQMKHGLSEDHANRRCSVLKSLIKGANAHSGKKNLSEEELAEYQLEIPEDFLVWLSETSEEEMLAEAREEEEKQGVVFKLKNLLGLNEPQEDEEVEEEQEDEETVGEEDSPSDASEDESVPQTTSLAYQLPYDLSKPEKISRKLWRKHLLPLGKKISYKGTTLDFSEGTLKRMVESAQRRAFDNVYVTVGHTRDADKGRGVLKDLFLKNDGDPDSDGLYGDFELSEEGEKVIANNLGAIGTSVSYHPDYTREADGEKFGPAIQHVAFTPTPHVPGLKPWEAIQMSEEEAEEVVDLTGAQYSAPDSREEDGPGMETQTPETTNEEVEMEEQQQPVVSLEEFNAMKAELEAERNDRQGIKNTLRNQGIGAMLKDMVNERKTTPAKAEAARVVLSALTTAESDVIELSDDGSAAVSEGDVGKAMLELMAPGELPEEGERGTTDLDASDDQDAFDRRVQELAREKYSGDYRAAFNELSATEEVSF